MANSGSVPFPGGGVAVSGAVGGIGGAVSAQSIDNRNFKHVLAFSRTSIASDHPRATQGSIDVIDEPSIATAARQAGGRL